MAMETTNPAPAPSAQVVGNAFVEQYYHILHHSPELVYRFYQDASVLSRPDPSGFMTTVTTMENINDKICSLDYKNFKAEIKTADAQESFEEGVIVLVTGCLTGKDNLRKKFTQTFFLAPQDKGYYVLNDVFRYVEEREPAATTDVADGVENTPSTTSTQDPEPAQVESPKPDLSTTHVEETVTVEEENDNGQVIDERPASHDSKVVEAESSLSENHASVAEESATSASQDDTPKKSYASIVSSQTKKGSTKVYVPSGTARAARAKTDKQPIHPAQEASSSDASANHPPVEEPEANDAHDEVEGHSIYIRNLPLNATVAQLEAEFHKFGPIKPNGVQVRSNRQQGFCFGFVEFQEFNSMQSAIKASPITIGDRQAFVEIKRTTTRVGGSVRGRFVSSGGGFRNDNFRGPGNFTSNRTYLRSDSFRGRGNFGSGRGSNDGYQQGRGRGGRRPVPN